MIGSPGLEREPVDPSVGRSSRRVAVWVLWALAWVGGVCFVLSVLLLGATAWCSWRIIPATWSLAR